ncbi:hypothetical protein HDU79_008879 [Rhizoclosmatium sp. JEL0117]|nr:hypothetical protein HDU79_008879 [Rhizoclosmatium sp. JEL0117]
MVKPSYACKPCRTAKRKCFPGEIACERCVHQGIEADCVFESAAKPQTAAPDSISAPLVPPSVIPIETMHADWNHQIQQPWQRNYLASEILDHIINEMDTPLVDKEEPHGTIEDIDLIPTYNDWLICYENYLLDRTGFVVDFERVVREFTSLSPALRLVMCLVGTGMCRNPYPEQIQYSYYKRAIKALNRYGTGASLELILAYYYLHIFSISKGQPAVGRRFLAAALCMIRELKLDIDPDDSPWLSHLTSRQKEERRRAFWGCFKYYATEKAIAPNSVDMKLNSDRIKGPGQDPASIIYFKKSDYTKWISKICYFIGVVKQAYSVPPTKVQDLIASEASLALNSKGIDLYTTFSTDVVLLSERAETLTCEDITRFRVQLAWEHPGDCYDCTGYYLASISILYRPQLFITMLKGYSPTLICRQTLSIILNAIHRCLESAHRITKISEYMKETKVFPIGYFSFAVFEAAIVFWFVACRMRHEWRELIPAVLLVDKQRALYIIERFVEIVAAELKYVGEADTVYLPQVQCMRAMVKELKDDMDDEEVEELELGMTVMSLGGSWEKRESVVEDPYGFLGLLGLSVGRGVRWRGRTEESWRLFWKLHS